MSASSRDVTPATQGGETQTSSPRARSSTPTFNLMDSQFPDVWVSAVIKTRNDRLKSLHAGRKTRPVRPIAPRLPSTLAKPAQKDPEDPLVLSWQRTLWYAFENFGRVGIALAIYKKAAEETQNASWDKLMDDRRRKTFYVLEHLVGLTDDAIRSLIRNTLPHDITKNRELAKFVRDSMVPRRAPSIYCMTIASSVENMLTTGGRTIPRPNAGKWLTPDQSVQMVRKCMNYHANKVGYEAMNQAIDSWGRKNPYTKSVRQWKSTSFKDWAPRFNLSYCANIDPTQRTTPWSKCPFEVGFAVNTVARLKQHAINSNTNSLWAPVHAIARLPTNIPNASGFGFPAPRQWELFPLIEDNERAAQIGEIVGSLLCSTYWFEGGLNPIFAGTASLSKFVVHLNPDDPKWNRQVQTFAERLEHAQCPDIEHDRFDTLCRFADMRRSRAGEEAESTRLEQKWKDQEQKTDLAIKRWKKGLREQGSLRRKLEEKHQDEEIRSASQDPKMAQIHSLQRRCRDAKLIARFVRMDACTFDGARTMAMDEEGVPRSIRERVQAQVEKEHEAAAEKRIERFTAPVKHSELPLRPTPSRGRPIASGATRRARLPAASDQASSASTSDEEDTAEDTEPEDVDPGPEDSEDTDSGDMDPEDTDPEEDRGIEGDPERG
ncbi:MAG: hypothetical protein Q9185_004463 [Variospora sp. 1 TL-2023]